MKITAIKQQVRQQGRYSIFVEGKYSFSLSEAALLESKIASGQELSAQQVKEFKKLSGDDKLYNQALRYVAMRQRSRWEIESYLQRKKADPLLSQKIINKLSDLQFIDDGSFAHNWIANRRLLKSTSRRRLLQELRAKRVPDDIIKAALAEDTTDEQAVLRELIAKKRRQTKYQDDTKLMQFLARQGYSYADIKSALTED